VIEKKPANSKKVNPIKKPLTRGLTKSTVNESCEPPVPIEIEESPTRKLGRKSAVPMKKQEGSKKEKAWFYRSDVKTSAVPSKPQQVAKKSTSKPHVPLVKNTPPVVFTAGRWTRTSPASQSSSRRYEI